MKFRKKVLSLVLAAAMAFTSVAMAASAQEVSVQPEASVSQAASTDSIIQSVVFSHNDVEDASVFVNETFDIIVKTTTAADQIYVYNENDLYIIHTQVGDYVEEGGVRTFHLSTSLGTPGYRKLFIHAYSNGQSLESFRKSIHIMPAESNGNIKSVEFLEDGESVSTLTTSKPFDMKVVTTTDVDNIVLLSEEGQYNRPMELTRTDDGDTRTFIYRSAVPTPGNRSFII